jgi:hypothetical protein
LVGHHGGHKGRKTDAIICDREEVDADVTDIIGGDIEDKDEG